jgi:hypothetical protein
MRLSDFKRGYKFKSKRNDRLSYIIAIIISAIVFVLLWYFL